MMKFQFLLLAFIAVLLSCTTTKTIPPDTTSSEDEEGIHIIMDSMEIIADDDIDGIFLQPEEYHGEEERTWDLIHTMLDLSFDWNQSAVIGTATLTLAPLFYPQSELKLDAVDFEIKRLLINGKASTNFSYDSNEITIRLPQPVTRRERLTFTIDYVAHPSPEYSSEGAAITSDQGLFFIDPLDTVPGLPRQIWTQGETSSNRRWFPTIDQPNERGTQEIILTVADTFMTLSNGALLSSTKLSNGMRRDHWKLELPHAPYLAMVAVGKWDKVSDTWRGRPVDYYVDPGYGPSARAIFAHTPEMIEFFSQILGFDFVWPKYAQVVVKNFVSGAMENTTAVIFGDFVQFHEDDMIEPGSNDYIVSHELFHHWFGDLVTCESWANLTLNEGFANYAEYLWTEYKYGRDKADVLRMSELSGYFDQAFYHVHPLIHHYYTDENEMFDAHSYNKGGLVLHMLRDLVGDEAFFASLRLYLQRNAYTSVETDDLRLAFEEITGKDLQWFFHQWFFEKGHPVLDVKHYYDEAGKELKVEISQQQDQQDFFGTFRLPVEIGAYYEDGTFEISKHWLENKTQTFYVNLNKKPAAVIIDPRDILLSVVQQEIPSSEYLTRLHHAPAISHRISAFRLMEDIADPDVQKMLMDSSVTIRALALQYLAAQNNAERMYQFFQTEENLDLRFYVLQQLATLDPARAKLVAEKLLETTKKNPVVYESLMAIGNVDVDAAILQATRYQANESPALYTALAGLYARKGSGITLDFFKTKKAADIPIDYLQEFIAAFAQFLSKQDDNTQQRGFDLLKSEFYLKGPIPEYRRFYMITGLLTQYQQEINAGFKEKLRQTVKYLYDHEPDDYLKEVLRESFGDVLD